MQRFVDKVVIITGSSAGIGQDAAIEFAKEGATVVIHGRDAERLKTENAILALGVPASRVLKVVGALEQGETAQKIVDETIKAYGRIDVLINNAGICSKPGVADPLDLANLDYIYAVDLRSVVQLTNLAMPHLERAKGNVLNISSCSAIRPIFGADYYCVIKAALDQWTRTLAMWCGHKGVRVNSINPGPIADTMIIAQRDGTRGPVDDKFCSINVMNRLGLPSELSPATKFLCSEQASFITGVCLLVDGGSVLGPSK